MTTQHLTAGPVSGRTGQTIYLPFDVPEGVNRVGVRLTDTVGAAFGVGLFDDRGPGWQSSGFRGIYGMERREAFVSADEAAPSFRPGTVRSGRWHVVVPVFWAPDGTDVTADVSLTFGPQPPPRYPGPAPGLVVDRPGWYRGDLHCHTPESSDAWGNGTALSPSAWAEVARALRLDFLALTDHNTITQNLDLAKAAGDGVLLIPGEEMTAWGHGHATVAGIEPGAWLDWRVAPLDQPKPLHGGRLRDFLDVARKMGAYVSAAHPFAPRKTWGFFADGASDPWARTDGIEVWGGPWGDDDEQTLALWDAMLQQGDRIAANGGSDLHGLINADGALAGTPTTVVWAERLETKAIVAGLRKGRSFITRAPGGVEIYLSASTPDGQWEIVGGAVHGEPEAAVDVAIVVRRAAGMRLVVWSDGAAVQEIAITDDEQAVPVRLAIPHGAGYVRAEVRRGAAMEALTNPIWLLAGPTPVGASPVVAPPPPW